MRVTVSGAVALVALKYVTTVVKTMRGSATEFRLAPSIVTTVPPLYTTRHDNRRTCIPDMELGHWVTGSMGHLGHLSRPGHRVIILTRCETRVFFPVFEKMPKMQNVHLKC